LPVKQVKRVKNATLQELETIQQSGKASEPIWLTCYQYRIPDSPVSSKLSHE